MELVRQSTKRAPRLSTIVPMNGDVKAANIPPSDTAPEIIVRDHSSSMVIGVTNIDSVATAGPCLANPAQQTANKQTSHSDLVEGWLGTLKFLLPNEFKIEINSGYTCPSFVFLRYFFRACKNDLMKIGFINL